MHILIYYKVIDNVFARIDFSKQFGRNWSSLGRTVKKNVGFWAELIGEEWWVPWCHPPLLIGGLVQWEDPSSLLLLGKGWIRCLSQYLPPSGTFLWNRMFSSCVLLLPLLPWGWDPSLAFSVPVNTIFANFFNVFPTLEASGVSFQYLRLSL